MKREMMAIVLGGLLITNIALAQDSVSKSMADGVSLREKLITNEQVGQLVAIDENNTHVFPNIAAVGFNSGAIPNEFTKALIDACDTKWQVKGFDPLTSKTGWVSYDGKANLYTREIEDKVTKRKEVVNGARCVDRFEIVDVWGEWRSLFSDGTGRYFQPRNFIIKHNISQPFKYKVPGLPEKVVMLPEGEVSALNPEKAAKKGFFAKLFTNDRPSSFELFEYAKILCQSVKGKSRGLANEGEFVANPRGGSIKNNERGYYKDSLAEKPLIDVYRHLFAGGYTSPDHLAKEWYFACEGTTNFIVRERENVTYDNRGKPSYSTTTYFAPDRGLDGVEFVKN